MLVVIYTGVGRREAECKENADTLMQLWNRKVRLSSNPSQCQEPGTSASFAIGSPLKNRLLSSACYGNAFPH